MTDAPKTRRIYQELGYPAPDFNKLVEGHAEYEAALEYALRYAHYVFGKEEMKKNVEEWIGRKFKNIPDHEFVTIGRVAWIINNSGYVSPDRIGYVTAKINEFSEREKKIDEVVVTDSPHTAFKKRTDNLWAALEGFVDDKLLNKIIDKTPFELVSGAGLVDTGKIRGYYSKIEQAIDEEFTSPIPNAEMKAIIGQIMDALSGIKTKVSKARKKKTLSPIQLTRKMNYMISDPETVASINPTKIIGAETWAIRLHQCFRPDSQRLLHFEL